MQIYICVCVYLYRWPHAVARKLSIDHCYSLSLSLYPHHHQTWTSNGSAWCLMTECATNTLRIRVTAGIIQDVSCHIIISSFAIDIYLRAI